MVNKSMIDLIKQLNKYRDSYYNHNVSMISDEEYDNLFDELEKMENETGTIMANSPTQTVGYIVQSKLKKVKHNHLMLSLGKTKDLNEITDFVKKNDSVAMLKMDGCFVSNTKILMANKTEKAITDVKIGDEVISYDEENKKITTSTIINIFHNGEKANENWLTFYLNPPAYKRYSTVHTHKKITCTKNHLFYTPNGYVEAQDLKKGDFVFTQGHKISKRQEQILLGMLLGDGFLVNRKQLDNNNFLEIHYAKTIRENYDELCKKIEKTFIFNTPSFSSATSGYSNTENNMSLINLHNLSCPSFIADKKNQLRCGLTFTKDICSHLTPLAFAVFYLDDGSKVGCAEDGYTSTTNIKPSCLLHTNRHKKENVKILSNYLNSIGIKNTIRLEKKVIDKNKGDGYIIFITSEGAPKFFDMIAPYIPKEFREIKLSKKWHDVKEINWWYDDSELNLLPVNILKIEPINNKKLSKRSYDLQIKNTHNYFANGLLVHNCTLSLGYDGDGHLMSAETRGNGEIGEDVFKNAKTIKNLPLKINNNGTPLIVDGEVIIDYDGFEKINESLTDNLKFSHTRNAAAGSIRQLDNKVAASRNMKFIAWKCIFGCNSNCFVDRLSKLRELGFEVVPYSYVSKEDIYDVVENLKRIATFNKYPIDGLVFSYDDVAYGESLGVTGHHVLCQRAFKFYDEPYETILRDIEWTTGRTGILAPVAIFDEVDLDGALTTRATLHNVTIMKKLKLGIGDTITVFRANQVIPKIDENLTKSNSYTYPTVCPSCGEKLELVKENDTENLYCPNEECPSRMLNKFSHLVSKSALNIDGLSEATLSTLIGEGFIKNYKDIYHLDRYKDKIINLDGFGKKSYDKLIKAIENSRNVKLENYLVALGIDNIGKTASKVISKSFKGSYNAFYTALGTIFDFTTFDDFGQVMNDSLYEWFRKYNPLEEGLVDELHFVVEEEKTISNDFINGKTFCITGAFNTMKRSEIEKIITDRGGKLSGSVSKKTDYLLTNEIDSGSSKSIKAKELGTAIMSESDFIVKISE